MRNFIVSALIATLVWAPSGYAVGNPVPLPGEPSEPGCEWCEYDYREDTITCEQGGTDWFLCKGGWINLPDGSGESGRVPNCGYRCYYA